MPVETTNPSAADILQGAPTVGGRASVILDEMKRRLEDNLPGVIALMNTREGWTNDDEKIRVPSKYYAGPVDGSENATNAVFLAASSTATVIGPAAFKGTYEVVVYSVDIRTENENQYLRNWDRIELIRATLKPFLAGCVNAEGRQCWKVLSPSNTQWLPEEFENYSGLQINYTATCDPSMNSWDELT